MTTIARSVDPRREQRLAEELDRIARHTPHAAVSSSLPAVCKRFVDLLELAERGLTQNTITDARHRYHNPEPGNILQLPAGEYVVVYLRVESVLTADGWRVWELGPCAECGELIERPGSGEGRHLDYMSHASDHAAAVKA